jgi:hypothetical protein
MLQQAFSEQGLGFGGNLGEIVGPSGAAVDRFMSVGYGLGLAWHGSSEDPFRIAVNEIDHFL